MIRKSRRLWDPPEPKPVVYRLPEVFVAPSPAIAEYRKEMERLYPADPLVVKNGGLKVGDCIHITTVPPIGGTLRGVQLRASRGKDWLLWQSGMSLFGRDLSGKFIYSPYLETLEDVGAFVDILSLLLGLSFVQHSGSTSTKWVFVLGESESPSKRLMPGDYVSLHEGILSVSRQQGTLDMNLYRPGFDDGNVILSHDMKFCRAPYHFKAVLGVLTEANGLSHTPLNGGFLVTK